MDQIYHLIAFFIQDHVTFRNFALVSKKFSEHCHMLQDQKKEEFKVFTVISDDYPILELYYNLPNGYKHGKYVNLYIEKLLEKYEDYEITLNKVYDVLINNPFDELRENINKVYSYENGNCEGKVIDYYFGNNSIIHVSNYKKGFVASRSKYYNDVCLSYVIYKYINDTQYATETFIAGKGRKRVAKYRNGKPLFPVKIYDEDILIKESICLGFSKMVVYYHKKQLITRRIKIYTIGVDTNYILTKVSDKRFDEKGNYLTSLT